MALLRVPFNWVWLLLMSNSNTISLTSGQTPLYGHTHGHFLWAPSESVLTGFDCYWCPIQTLFRSLPVKARFTDTRTGTLYGPHQSPYQLGLTVIGFQFKYCFAIFYHYSIVGQQLPTLGSLRNGDEKRHLKSEFALPQTYRAYSISFNLSNVVKFLRGWILKDRTASKFRKRKRKLFSFVPVLDKMWNWAVSCSCATTVEKCTKKRDARAKLLFC